MTCDTHSKRECRTITINKTDSQLQNLHYQGPLGILMVDWSFRISLESHDTHNQI